MFAIKIFFTFGASFVIYFIRMCVKGSIMQFHIYLFCFLLLRCFMPPYFPFLYSISTSRLWCVYAKCSLITCWALYSMSFLLPSLYTEKIFKIYICQYHEQRHFLSCSSRSGASRIFVVFFISQTFSIMLRMLVLGEILLDPLFDNI